VLDAALAAAAVTVFRPQASDQGVAWRQEGAHQAGQHLSDRICTAVGIAGTYNRAVTHCTGHSEDKQHTRGGAGEGGMQAPQVWKRSL
jgi:hypothetical protein